jgi:hypothetical protein
LNPAVFGLGVVRSFDQSFIGAFEMAAHGHLGRTGIARL